ncbi:cobalamin cluster protein [Halobacteriales archaeon QS_6_64_34]|nr:MAG: cobalamin cluster protein [Halobacteriales archaeon QS_6_64_34]
MQSSHIQRGIVSGTATGIAYSLYMLFVGNPLSSYIEHVTHGHTHGSGNSGKIVSEAITAAISASSGLLWGILLGGVFGVIMFLFEPGLPGSERIRSYVLAVGGFLTVSGIPWMVLPPAVPGAVYQYPVETRMRAYFGLALIGAVTFAAAVSIYKYTTRRHIGIRILAGTVPVLAVATVLSVATPTITTFPDIPADLVAAYQALTIFTQLGMWILIAALFNLIHNQPFIYVKERYKRSII